jgi:tRNA(Ile)-lysidine synthase
MTDLVHQIDDFIATRQLLRNGQKVLVAVSGGVDSMVLIHVLHRLAPDHRWQLAVAHFNHQLRGLASEADEALVRRTAARLGWPFRSGRGDVRAFQRQHKLSLEMAARHLRFEFLTRAAQEWGIPAIALAHHAGDQVELFFLRLLRGSGTVGLSGMKPAGPAPQRPELALVRPLLTQHKSDLMAFAKAHKIPFREDASNASREPLRNRFRHELIPCLKRRYQPALERVVLRLMDLLAEEAGLVAELASKWRQARKPMAFERLPPAVQRGVLQAELIQIGIEPDYDLVEMLRLNPGKRVSAGARLLKRRVKEGSIVTEMPANQRHSSEQAQITLDRSGSASFGHLDFCWQVRDVKDDRPQPAFQPRRELFDADQVGEQVRLRYWRPGDRFQPIGMSQAVKLQDLFVNLKIPKPLRHQKIIAEAQDGEVFWVEGLRIGERFKLSSQTRHCLAWSWQEQSSPAPEAA